MKKLILLILPVLLLLNSCAKDPEPKLISKAEITDEIKATLKEKGLNTDDEIDLIYSGGDLSLDAVFVTKKVIAGHKEGEIYGCDLLSVFDMAHNHSYDTTNESTIKIFLKDDSKFTVTFPGAVDFDEIFFKEFKSNWRDAISTAQKETVQ